VLLVGLTTINMSVLEGPLSDVAEVSAVPFPGAAFDDAADDLHPDLVIVDITYLDEAVVRPLITHRLAHTNATVVYLSDTGPTWFDDLGAVVSGPLENANTDTLIQLVSGPTLRLIGGTR
jgi:hypothetical protein